jgi:uncharacterized protein (TIGR02145 family)
MKLNISLKTIVLSSIILIMVACENGTEPSSEPAIPVLTTTAVSAITASSALAGGNITADGGADVTARGVCWSTNSTPTIADDITNDGVGTGSFTSAITGLSANTAYNVRAYATNSAGTGYGNNITFTTSTTTEITVTDYDGNVYPTVQIGTQVWMAENFRGLHASNGNLLTGVYVYNGSESYAATYGRLYTWEAALSANPEGWHLPTDAEWDILATFLGAEAGTQLKVGGSSGFNAPLGGMRPYQGGYTLLDEWGMFWTATYTGLDHAAVINLFPNQTGLVVSGAEVIEAISVRYVRDE